MFDPVDPTDAPTERWKPIADLILRAESCTCSGELVLPSVEDVRTIFELHDQRAAIHYDQTWTSEDLRAPGIVDKQWNLLLVERPELSMVAELCRSLDSERDSGRLAEAIKTMLEPEQVTPNDVLIALRHHEALAPIRSLMQRWWWGACGALSGTFGAAAAAAYYFDSRVIATAGAGAVGLIGLGLVTVVHLRSAITAQRFLDLLTGCTDNEKASVVRGLSGLWKENFYGAAVLWKAWELLGRKEPYPLVNEVESDPDAEAQAY